MAWEILELSAPMSYHDIRVGVPFVVQTHTPVPFLKRDSGIWVRVNERDEVGARFNLELSPLLGPDPTIPPLTPTPSMTAGHFQEIVRYAWRGN